MNNFTTSILTKRSTRLMFAGFAFVLAVLYDFLIWDNEAGLGLSLFVLLYIAGFLLLNMSIKHVKNGWAFLLLLPVGIMSIDVVLLNNELVRDGVPIFILVLLFIFSVLVTLKNPDRYKFSFAKIPIIRNILIILKKIKDFQDDIFTIKKDSNSEVLGKIFKGIAISIPVLILFGILFSNADAVFAQWIDQILDFEINSTLLWRIIRTIGITTILIGFFYFLMSEKHKLGEKVSSAIKLDKITTITVLTLINSLFLLFVFLQIQYLFGNAEFVNHTGTTFAEYARSGFFELVWVIIFASLILGIVYKSFSHHGESKFVKLLQVILVAQVAVIAFSALKRMNLYQEAYGYTILRLYVEWFIYLLLTLMFLGAGSLITSIAFRKYFYFSLIISLTALTIVASVNVDYLIAKQNIQRFIEGENVELDTHYIGQLSVDATMAFDMLKGVKLSEDQMWYVQYVIEDKLRGIRSESSLFEYTYNKAEAETKLPSLKQYFENKEAR